MLERETELTRQIIGAAIEVHKTLGGPGLLESVYKEALDEELRSIGLRVEREAPCPIVYKGKTLGAPLRIDLLVEGRIVVEAKAATANNPLFAARCLTYLRLRGLKLGLVINFGRKYVADGLERVLNPLAFSPEEAQSISVPNL